ncbi:MAG: WYL domain-containing protein [Clostridiales bacterium]|nr:WYL domain-containing protein [Clostridiales bacterium]
MAKGQNQKRKALYLAKIFFEETDESHGLTAGELIARLQQYGVSVERKTLYQDIEDLRQFGMDIVAMQSGRAHTYHLVSRTFELPELKLLVDAVQSSKFITERKSRGLIRKLETLCSIHDGKQLQRQVLIAGRVKTMNESIYYNVDDIHTAISRNCQIRFHYFQWNLQKEEELRRGGAWYCVSPWHLRWDDENYYLIAYESSSDTIKHYRVDKMRNITVTDAPREGQAKLAAFDPAAYTKRLFGMYAGEETRVALECENRMIGVLVDRFGKDFLVIRKDEGHFAAYVDAAVSEQFLGWVISLGSGVKLTAPEDVVERMREEVRRLNAQYL